MVGDMFNTQLKAKLAARCSDIARFMEASTDVGGRGARSSQDRVSFRSTPRAADWWPAGLGTPAAVEAQNDLRYAVFPDARRLVTDDHGAISVHDTGAHWIFGVVQAQSSEQTLSFTLMISPRAQNPAQRQESVWDYPRPPRLERTEERLCVIFVGETIADAMAGCRVLETSHLQVYYIPPADIAVRFLECAPGTPCCEL